MGTKPCGERIPPKTKMPTFLLELPLVVEAGQAVRVGAHLEAGRQCYNAVLSADSAACATCELTRTGRWPAPSPAHAPRSEKPPSALRERYGFSEYAFHELAKKLRVWWLAEHLEAVLAQTLATSAYRALNRVCVGKAHRVRFKSRGRGLSSIENKRNDTGLRLVLDRQKKGIVATCCGMTTGYPCSSSGTTRWSPMAWPTRSSMPAWCDALPPAHAHTAPTESLIGTSCNWYWQAHPTTSPRTWRARTRSAWTWVRQASPSCRGTARPGSSRCVRSCVQMRELSAACSAACSGRARRQSRALRRAGSAKEAQYRGQRLEAEPNYQVSRRRKAAQERKLAAHRKSLHGQMIHQIAAVGHTIITEKISYKAWHRRYGKSVGRGAPGMLIAHLKRTVASTGGTLHEVPTRSTKLSQYCHGCGEFAPKPHAPRWHQCQCGIGPVQRDLYSAFLGGLSLSSRSQPLRVPGTSGIGRCWRGRRRACRQHTSESSQRANEGQRAPRSMGIPRAGARLPKSPSEATPELLFLSRVRGKVEAWRHRSEPPVRRAGGVFSSGRVSGPGIACSTCCSISFRRSRSRMIKAEKQAREV